MTPPSPTANTRCAAPTPDTPRSAPTTPEVRRVQALPSQRRMVPPSPTATIDAGPLLHRPRRELVSPGRLSGHQPLQPKFAVTVVACVSTSVHGPVPEQPPPDQPRNTAL